MSDQKFISQRNLLGIKGDGVRVNIVVGVGIPYRDERFDSWACSVKIDGLHGELADIHGIDSWQALRLAQKTVVMLLGGLLKKAGISFF